jgi:hypothetical protein
MHRFAGLGWLLKGFYSSMHKLKGVLLCRFAGLGWLASRAIFALELLPKWPDTHWDHWVRAFSYYSICVICVLILLTTTYVC